MSDSNPPAGEERKRPWGALAVVLLTLLVVIADLKGMRDLRLARATAGRLENRIEAAQGRLEGLERRRAQLESGEAALERLARDDLGMVRPGDVVILLPGDEAEPAVEPPEPPGGQGP